MFKKNKDILKENINNASNVCSKINEEDMKNKFYVDEKAKLISLLIVISQETYKTKKRVFSETEFDNVLKIYLKTWEMAHSSFENKKQLSQYISENVFTEFKDSSEFPFSQMVRASMACIEYIRESDKALNAEKFLLDKSTPQGSIKISSNRDIANFLKCEEKKEEGFKLIASYNKEVEEKGKEKDDYGLIPQNPVFVNGDLACREYLNHLFDESDCKLSFSNMGSMTTLGIAGTIEAYRAFYVKEGKEVDKGMIFICIFGNKKNSTPPTGYVYK